MKRVLLDQGLPAKCAALLREIGWDAIHVKDLDMCSASDEEILRRAARDDRVCITLDKDFHALLAESSAKEPSVVRIRMQGLEASRAFDLLTRVWGQIEPALVDAVAVTVREGAVRIRQLPLR